MLEPTSLVFTWLETVGVGHAVPKFRELHINSPTVLMGISPDDYPELGVTGARAPARVLSFPPSDRPPRLWPPPQTRAMCACSRS